MGRVDLWHSGGMLLLALVLAGCGKDAQTSGPVAEAERPIDEAVPPPAGLQAETPAVPQPDRASAPLVSDTEIDTTPVTIFGQSTPIIVLGEEPAWEARFEAGWIEFERPGLPLVEVPLPDLPAPSSGILSFKAGNVLVTITEDGCETAAGSLGVQISFDEVEYEGCGRARNSTDTEVAEVSWQDLISDHVTAIDACLSEADGLRFIRALYPREEDTVGMILVDELGRYEECGAQTSTGEISFFDPVMPDQADMWIDGPGMFARSGKSPECDSVSSQGGVQIGEIGTLHPAGCAG